MSDNNPVSHKDPRRLEEEASHNVHAVGVWYRWCQWRNQHERWLKWARNNRVVVDGVESDCAENKYSTNFMLWHKTYTIRTFSTTDNTCEQNLDEQLRTSGILSERRR